MKFGGTSVQDASAITQASEIIRGRLKRRPIVVVSAMAKVTDALLRIARSAKERKHEEAVAIISEIRDRHLSTARELIPADSSSKHYSLTEVEERIREKFSDLEGLVRSVATLGELTPRTQDAISSFGERLSSLIIAAALNHRDIPADVVDSRELILTDDQFTSAVPDMDATEFRSREALNRVIERGLVPVTQGFIGATTSGLTTTLGRGGSDYSAAIIGASVGAEAIEIWTDVDGLMTADPRVVPDARRIRVISFAEAAELSYFGAKVLHPSTVIPAVKKGIPVHIYNTLNPSCEGTLIVDEARPTRNVLKSIAFKRGITIVNVASTRMLMAHGFLRAIFEVFERNRTSVDVVTTSEVSVSITVDNTEALDAIEEDLSRIGEVTVERGRAIVCVVGDNLKSTPGVAARLFTAIKPTNVNMISQGASEINLTFVINDSDVDRVARALHNEFFSEPDPEVFG